MKTQITSIQSSSDLMISDDAPFFSDHQETWDHSSDFHFTAEEESEVSLYDEDLDQVADTVDHLDYPNLSSDGLLDDIMSSPIARSDLLEESDYPHPSPGSSSLSKDDLQVLASSSPLLPSMEHEQSSSTSSSFSLTHQEEPAQPPATISKTSKGTLIFVKSLQNKFFYNSVTSVPNTFRSKGKSKKQFKI